jgi:CRISPR-associated endoribonuclease Cas6
MEYHYHLQGLIYKLIDGSKHDVHDKAGSKFFSFSNVFPFTGIQKDDLRNLMISSPNDEFISYLCDRLGYDKHVSIGKMKFIVEFCDKLDVRIPNNDKFSLITGTPIIIRINNRDGRYDVDSTKAGHRDPIYWRTIHPIDVFIKQLEDNLIKKYNRYFELDIQGREPIFNKFKFKKQISNRLCLSTTMQPVVVIGTTWEFLFEHASPLIQFALDCGLGELNSMGFGFMNLIKGRNDDY